MKILTSIILGILLGVMIGLILVAYLELTDTGPISDIKKINNITETSDIIELCSNKSLFSTAFCIQDEIKTFYKYNISNIGKKLTFKKLKEEGGVCSHWQKLWCEIGKELGFETSGPSFWINNTFKHTFCILSSDDGYVIADNDFVSFVRFQNRTKLEENL